MDSPSEQNKMFFRKSDSITVHNQTQTTFIFRYWTSNISFASSVGYDTGWDRKFLKVTFSSLSCDRKYQKEQEIRSMLWRIKFEDIEMIKSKMAMSSYSQVGR